MAGAGALAALRTCRARGPRRARPGGPSAGFTGQGSAPPDFAEQAYGPLPMPDPNPDRTPPKPAPAPALLAATCDRFGQEKNLGLQEGPTSEPPQTPALGPI